MKPLRDTDERRPRPSVWPVYVMSGIIGLFSLSFLVLPWFAPMVAHMYAEYPEAFQGLSPDVHQVADMMQQLSPYAVLFGVYGLFGIATAIGVAFFRSWSWWCAIVWGAGQLLWDFLRSVNWPMYRGDIWGILITVVLLVLLVWPLATRRQLFFPPKPEREE